MGNLLEKEGKTRGGANVAVQAHQLKVPKVWWQQSLC